MNANKNSRIEEELKIDALKIQFNQNRHPIVPGSRSERRKADRRKGINNKRVVGPNIGWVLIQEAQPKAQQRVYVVCEKPKHNGGVVRFQTIAEYIPYMTIKEEDYMSDEYQGEGDYNQEQDEYYTPKGFYEWQSETEAHWKISAKVTHWMPMIALP